jgi:hypothetical protein
MKQQPFAIYCEKFPLVLQRGRVVVTPVLRAIVMAMVAIM